MIDRIIIPNLKRREDKWYFMLGALHHAGLNTNREDFIIRHIAHDGKDYRDDLQVRDAAIADGFDGFTRFDGRHNRLPVTNMAWFWTWNSVMRKIAEMPKGWQVLYLIDDVYPAQNYTWDRINKLAQEVLSMEGHSKFRGVQLHQDMKAHEYRPPAPLINSSVLSYGWMSRSDVALLLTPECAEMLMNVFADFQRGPKTTHNVITAVANRGCKDDNFYKGFWHTTENVFTHGSHFDTDILW